MKHAIERLEFGAVKAALLRRVQTPLGSEAVNALKPFEQIEAATARSEAIRQARVLLENGEPPPVWGAADVHASLELGEKGVMLEGPALRAIANTMNTGSLLRRHLLDHEKEAPALYGLAASLQDLSRTAGEVLRCFDPDGQLADDASPELGPLRRRVRSLRESIHDKITEILHKSEVKRYLQEDYYTIRADRYVLPVKASFKNDVKGIVHDASGSGQTVYIEPQVLVDLGNRVKIAQSEQQEEENRILSRLTVLVSKEADMVREMMQVVGLCDLVSGCARLAKDLDCVPIVPDRKPGFALIDARHPILLLQSFDPGEVESRGQDERSEASRSFGTDEEEQRERAKKAVVGNDLGLQDEQKVLILTGPNTGGKTVAMKTIGLLAIMVRCGLHLPCDERSRIGWFPDIEVAIGDLQSITSNLSTFAAHMKELVGILQHANQRSLVLIDEIVSDTDPTQGQALAQALLEALAEARAHTVVTTHFERLRAVPFADQRFRNAGVGFDTNRLRPTYQVTLDIPQGSSGFDIAQALGLPEALVERARNLTGEGSQEIEGLLTELQRQSTELEQARRELEEAKRALEEEKANLQGRQDDLTHEIKSVRMEGREELLQEIAETRGEVRRIIATLQSAKDTQAAPDAMRGANEASKALAKIEQEEERELEVEGGRLPQQKALDRISPGDWVHVQTFGQDGDVIAIDGKEVHVAVGNMRMRVARSAIFPAKKGRSRQKVRAEPVQFKKPKRGEKVEITEELDLRGLTVDVSLDQLDAFLDHHYGKVTTHLRVIHGHGTGALREGIRDHLRLSGYVKHIRPGESHEGGDGVTVVVLS